MKKAMMVLAITALAASASSEPGCLDLATHLFDYGQVRVLGGNCLGEFTVDPATDVGRQPRGIVAADFNGDGLLDLASTAYADHTVSILINQGSRVFQRIVPDIAVANEPQRITAADFNGDNSPDLAITCRSADAITVLINDGSGNFVTRTDFPIGNWPLGIAASDLNGDAIMDIVVANHYGHSVSIMFGDGLAGFATDSLVPIGEAVWQVSCGDLNSDLTQDIVVTTADGFVVLLGDGIGGFTAMPEHVLCTACHCSRTYLGDLNGDGCLDLAVSGHDDEQLHILLGQCTGEFELHQTLDVGYQPVGIASGDFDGNETADLALVIHNESYISIFSGDGTGTFALQEDIDLPGEPHTIVAGDFDATPTIPIALDIKPGSCPNPLNVGQGRMDGFDVRGGSGMAAGDGRDPAISEVVRGKKAVLPVAILGTAEFDVALIDATTVVLEGVPVVRWHYEDVATPIADDAEECECNTEGPDGFGDMTLKFYRAEIIAALGEVYDGDVIPLTISGQLLDGTPFEGVDCVVILGDNLPMADVGGDDVPSISGVNNYPNPFNPVTTISFSLPVASHVSLEVYNVMGQRVTTVADGFYEAGVHACEWDGSEVASGVYFYRIETPEFAETKKMMLLK